jgi:hypothetical protein
MTTKPFERRVRRVRGPELLSINPGVILAYLEPKCAVHSGPKLPDCWALPLFPGGSHVATLFP